jgi:hypothetical protein
MIPDSFGAERTRDRSAAGSRSGVGPGPGALDPAQPGLVAGVGQGAVLQPFSPEVMDGCYKAAQELYAELNQTNPAFKKVYDSYKAFQDDSYLWHQIADYTMDAYMIRYRNQKT